VTLPGLVSRAVYTPLGPLMIEATDAGLTAVVFDAEPAPHNRGRAEPGHGSSALTAAMTHLDCAALELTAYFAGQLRRFSVPLDPAGTAFERRVWNALGAIPFGQTTSYGALAARLAPPGVARAVGRANARNPIAILIPCHRVIGADGALTGYAAGLPRKAALLALERAQPELPLAGA
jgi:O-6-methylguanine DNA methyltransferase